MTMLEEVKAVLDWFELPETQRRMQEEKISMTMIASYMTEKDNMPFCEVHYTGTTSGAVLNTCSEIKSHMDWFTDNDDRVHYFSTILDFLKLYVSDDDDE